MRIVLQRVSRASVTIAGKVAGSIDRGFCLLVGFTHGDTPAEVDWMAEKAAGLRAELGQPDAELERRAGELLARTGARAFSQLDFVTASDVLERAASLLPQSSTARWQLVPDLAIALMEAGRADDAAVLLEDAPDDGKAEARALFARRHVGLKQPVAVFLRQADAVVDHVDDRVPVLAHAADRDPPLPLFLKTQTNGTRVAPKSQAFRPGGVHGAQIACRQCGSRGRPPAMPVQDPFNPIRARVQPPAG